MLQLRFQKVTPVMAALLLLVGLGVERVMSHSPSGDAQRYHDMVAGAFESAPTRLGDWVSQPVAPPVRLWSHRPNAILSRRYIHVDTGYQATVLLAQVRDARDMLGFDPPQAYGVQGWTVLDRRTLSIDAGGWPARCAVYDLELARQMPWRRLTVASMYILPDGKLSSEYGTIKRAASHYTVRYLGAAQIHVLLDQRILPSERDDVINDLMTSHLPLIRLLEAEKEK